MNEMEIRFNALLQELQAQRDVLGARAANCAAENAILKQKIADLELALKEAGTGIV